MKSNFYNSNDLPKSKYNICIMPRNFGKTYALNKAIEKKKKKYKDKHMSIRRHKRLLNDLYQYNFYHMFTPYQQRCVDETIRIIKLNIAYHKAHKRNK